MPGRTTHEQKGWRAEVSLYLWEPESDSVVLTSAGRRSRGPGDLGLEDV